MNQRLDEIRELFKKGNLTHEDERALAKEYEQIMRTIAPIEDSCYITMEIVLNSEDKRVFEKLEWLGFEAKIYNKKYYFRKRVKELRNVVSVSELLEIVNNVSLFIDSTIHNQMCEVVIRNSMKNIKVNRNSHTTDEFVELVLNSLKNK